MTIAIRVSTVVAALTVVLAAVGQPADEVLFRDAFSDGMRNWRVQGEGFKASVIKGENNEGGMARLDNSAGTKQAYLGFKAGPPDTWLVLSFAAKSGVPTGTKVGIHRYRGPIKWVGIGDEWQRVSGTLRSHATVPNWYIVVPPGAVVCVDTVELRPLVMDEAAKAERRRTYRAAREQAALIAYRALDRANPARGSSVHVDGEFPVGFYITRPSGGRGLSLEEIFREHGAAKVNVEHNSDFEDWPEHTKRYDELNSNATAAAYIGKAQKHGIGSLIGFDRMMVLKGNVAGIQERVKALKDTPGLFGWYLLDEPTVQGTNAETMQRAYRAVKELDPDHPVVATLCAPDRMGEFAPSTDVLLVDRYPVSLEPLFTVAIHVETALAVTGGKKAVWGAIQLTCQDTHRLKRGGEAGLMVSVPRLPTVREIRCMTYLAIAHGASGILFYAYDGMGDGRAFDDPKRYRGILGLTREIHGLGPLLGGDCLRKGTVPGQNGVLVSYIVRGRDRDRAVLVATNAFDRPSGPVEIPTPDGRVLRATLQPHDVLIKRWGDDVPAKKRRRDGGEQ